MSAHQHPDRRTRHITPPRPDWPCSRWYCPFPGCKRSFAELWRLKVHYRAPPDVRGSGRERGHGTELTHCPKCGKGLKPGKHHVGCAAGRTAPRQASKRSRSVSRSVSPGPAGWRRIARGAASRLPIQRVAAARQGSMGSSGTRVGNVCVLNGVLSGGSCRSGGLHGRKRIHVGRHACMAACPAGI